MRTHHKSPRTDGSGDPVDNQEMTSQWVVAQCPYCDEHGYLPNGFRCPHEPPEVTAERAHRGAQLARTQLRPTTQTGEQETT